MVGPAARASFGLPADGQAAAGEWWIAGGGQPQSARSLGGRGALLAAGVSVLHAVGPKNVTDDLVTVTDPTTGAVYRPLPYIEAMDVAYAAADLMLGRCGASTVLETAAVGLPAVFVPYPHGNGEQARNAAGVVSAGGGVLLADVDCTAEWVTAQVPSLIRPDVLRGMSAALADVGHSRRRDRAGPGDAAGGGLAGRGRRGRADDLMGLLTPVELVEVDELGRSPLHRHRRLGHERHRLRPAAARRRGQRQRPAGLEVPRARWRPRAPGCTSVTTPPSWASARTVVASSAIREDNPELAEARRRGLRVLHRSAALGSIMLGRRGVAGAPAPMARPPPRR